jgi:hypothetical protein
MKLGFICPNVPGHLNPMTALARQLQAATMRLSSSIRQRLPAYRVFRPTRKIRFTKTCQKSAECREMKPCNLLPR